MPQLSEKKKAHCHLCTALDELSAGNTKQALREIDKAIKLADGREAGHWAAKSRILYRLGEHQEAEAAARNAIRIDEQSYHAWVTLGMLYFHSHRFEKAAFCYKKVVEIEEDYSFYTLLAAAERQFDPESAIEHAKRALELNPDWDEAETILSDALEDLRER